MALEFHEENTIVRRIKRQQDGTTFLFGAALSQAYDGGPGIPNVEGVLNFIEDYVQKIGEETGEDDLATFQEKMKGANSQEKYQEAFNFIAGEYGQVAINEIIRDVVESNLDGDGKQRIPPAIKDFVTGIKNGNFRVNNIITTNFDTLLEEEFKNQEIPFNSFSVVADTRFPKKINGEINIYHLHGIWEQGDSMHTTSQLKQSRSRIEMSMQNLVGSDLVVVMAYSGWEDSFTRALAKAVTNTESEYDILWSFFEPEPAKIEYNRKELFKTLEDAITRGRVQFYSGVDCNSTFAKLSKVTALKKKD